MRALFFMALVVFPGCAAPQTRPTPAVDALRQVDGLVTRSQSYCGGAEPTPETLAELQKPKPAPGFHLLVRSGRQNSDAPIMAELVTDADGRFQTRLREGTYCVVGEAKRRVAQAPTPDPQANEACLLDRRRTCDAVWKIEDRDLGAASVEYHIGCTWADDPCYPNRHMDPPP